VGRRTNTRIKHVGIRRDITNISTLTISSTETNKSLLIPNGFHYTISQSTEKKTYWKREYSRSMTCERRVHMDLNYSVIINEPPEHNHPPSVVNFEVRLFQDKICFRAINTTEDTEQVMHQCLRDVTDRMVARLPSFKHVIRTIQRQCIMSDLPQSPLDNTFAFVPA
jgi:hypothetical protein